MKVSKTDSSLSRRAFVAGAVISGSLATAQTVDFESHWDGDFDQPWPGSEYWANPMQDWRVRAGRVECFAAGGDRNLHLLTHDLAAGAGDLLMSVRMGRLEDGRQPLGEGFAGFRIGIRGHFRDWRDSAIYGEGINAGILADGRLFIGSPKPGGPRFEASLGDVQLELHAQSEGAQGTLTLRASARKGGHSLELKSGPLASHRLTGALALVCSSGPIPATPGPLTPIQPSGMDRPHLQRRGGTWRFWFQDWSIAGSKVRAHPQRAFGPIYFCMHTLSRGVLKMTAQLAPLDRSGGLVHLEIQTGAGSWQTIATSPIDALARTATFRVPGWDDSKDVPYRIRYPWKASGETRSAEFSGMVRRDPRNKPEMVFGALTCNNDLGFPHTDIVRNLRHFQPDMLVFTGDQIYERVGGYGTQRDPLDAAALDYLRKWILFGWAYRDLLRDIPTVTIPDDHDVFHGNVWGAGGKKAEAPVEIYPSNPGSSVVPSDRITAAQDTGGYTMPAVWVNMIQRTQTSHLPDPFDPTPVLQGIGVYYTSLVYGGVSFAIVEDRKWKSAPRMMIPWADIRDGWAQNPKYRAARDGDVAGAELLGNRQIDFLEHWAADWKGAWMKIVISQTLFADLVTLPPPANTDEVMPELPILPLGGYAPNDVYATDHDSNGWPRTPRNRALRAFRKAVALHVGGDQHLGSTVQYGIDNWNDGPYALCTPAIASVWPRRWFPPAEGRHRKPGAPRNSGEYTDGFGNKMTVHAVANPAQFGAEPRVLHKRAPGYGIVRLKRNERTIELTNWPRYVDAWKPDAKPYRGWPVVIHQLDNGLTATRYELDEIRLPGEQEPVLQVVDEATQETVYTLRCPGSTFAPPVFQDGRYTVRLLDEEGKIRQQWTGLAARTKRSG